MAIKIKVKLIPGSVGLFFFFLVSGFKKKKMCRDTGDGAEEVYRNGDGEGPCISCPVSSQQGIIFLVGVGDDMRFVFGKNHWQAWRETGEGEVCY